VFAEHVDAQRAGRLVDIDVLTVALLAADVEPAGLAQAAPMAQRDPNERIRDSTEHASCRRLPPGASGTPLSAIGLRTRILCARSGTRESVATSGCRSHDRRQFVGRATERPLFRIAPPRPRVANADFARSWAPRNLAQPLPRKSGRCGRAVRQGVGSLLGTTSRATSRPLRDRMSRAIAVRSPPRVARHLPTRAHSSSRSVALLLHAGPRMGGGT